MSEANEERGDVTGIKRITEEGMFWAYVELGVQIFYVDLSADRVKALDTERCLRNRKRKWWLKHLVERSLATGRYYVTTE